MILSYSSMNTGHEKHAFRTLLISRSLTNLGDVLSSPKTVLTWVLGAVGAPAAMIALLVPIRESLSMLPQLALGAWVRRRPLRKPIWMLGSLLQALAVTGCAVSALVLRGNAAGLAVLTCVTVFALARSLSSIANKDILGKTIPKGRRGRLTGWGAGISGALSLGVGLWFTVGARNHDDVFFYVALLAGAGSLWLVAMAVLAGLPEEAGEVAIGRGWWRDTWTRLDLLRSDPPFRRFVLTRALLMSSALSSPYYVLLARQHEDADASRLGAFLLAGGLASSVASPIWGTLADRSSRLVMARAGLLTALLGMGIFAIERWASGWNGSSWLFPLFFFGLGIAHAGVRAGRKVYIVDLAGGVRRTDYVSVSNSLIGVLLLLMGGLASALSFLPPEWTLLGLSMAGLLGSGLAAKLPETDD